eukprot:TRINITY_DN29556_c0_g1_i1.p1 TRINITY_DN29556_c0_g1~~TRINITY_DN29556_c0_g1_i1.p1  ORF type:complete len:473 (-),score=131.67 TRINITY_DN29556_c0_g1_i1:72-1280(-)
MDMMSGQVDATQSCPGSASAGATTTLSAEAAAFVPGGAVADVAACDGSAGDYGDFAAEAVGAAEGCMGTGENVDVTGAGWIDPHACGHDHAFAAGDGGLPGGGYDGYEGYGDQAMWAADGAAWGADEANACGDPNGWWCHGWDADGCGCAGADGGLGSNGVYEYACTEDVSANGAASVDASADADGGRASAQASAPVESLVDPQAPDPGTGRASAVRRGDGHGKADREDGGRWSRDSTWGEGEDQRWGRSGRRGGDREGWTGSEGRNGSGWRDRDGGSWQERDGASSWQNDARGGSGRRSDRNGRGGGSQETADARSGRRGSGDDEGTADDDARWAYIDPNDKVRTGFTTENMKEWFDHGYFGADLKVALVRDGRTPLRSDFYPLKKWFRERSSTFTYVPKF